MRFCCTWCVLFFFLFTFFTPEEALSFDTDTLKTAGIITGITIGVALIVVLVAGTIRDTKRKKDEEEKDDDVWSQSPVLRTLGYRHANDPLFGRSTQGPDTPPEEDPAGRGELEAFLKGRMDRALFDREAGEEPLPFSLWKNRDRSSRIDTARGGSPETT
jgi:hypothetical protein